MEDLSAVPQEKIVDYLLERLQCGKIYTWVGTLLLALNPNGEISTGDIYDLSRVEEYENICDVSHKEVSPHIYAVAARAHYRIVQNLGKRSQVIVLNGETGTGKTFNAVKALEFLTRSASANAESWDRVCNIVWNIRDACRLISPFTIAPTERNQVSSRHVQLVWLEYERGTICGAKISSYLLERDRVTKGCCNFQIFGQMMSAIENIEFADLELSKDTRYFIINDLDDRKMQEYRDDFCDTVRVMDTLKLLECHKKMIFRVLAFLVHMGNIQFVQEDDYCRIDTDDLQSKRALENSCRVAGIDKKSLVKLLTSTLINPRNSGNTKCRRNLTTIDACRYRLHSIIRYVYDLVFQWLITFVNRILLSPAIYGTNEQLGILDIFGFECFASNGIEQLCVNYVNERLQQYFVEKYLLSCRKNLEMEGLIGNEEPSEIVKSYEDRINTIEKYLFAPLNDVCLATVQNDMSTFISQVCASSRLATRRFLNVKNENFVVQHYAGPVKYSICDLLSKNTDKIPDEITTMFMKHKKNTFLDIFLNRMEEERHYNSGRAKKLTMLSKLRSNANLLIRELRECDTHYVRCIKPRRLVNCEWDRDELHKQLVNTGIFDALPLAKCKYPIHFAYKDFYKRYRRKHTEISNLRIYCKNIVKFSVTMDDVNSSIYYGKRSIFLTESMFLQLETARRRYRIECVKKIESFWIENKQQIYVQKYQRQNTIGNTDNNTRTIVNVTCQSEMTASSPSDYIFSLKVDDGLDGLDRMYYRPEDYHNDKKILAHKFSKIAFIFRWLLGVQEAMYAKKIEVLDGPPEPKRPRLDSDFDQSIDTNCNEDVKSQSELHTHLDNKFHIENRCEKNYKDHNEDENIHIIQYGTLMLFYRNRVLSRRRPTKIPIKMHTRLRCLTNSHYLTYTQLPQGLKDCL
ncbi:hypothetical protein P5V15_008490 [Pogonomyrmex californicus]